MGKAGQILAATKLGCRKNPTLDTIHQDIKEYQGKLSTFKTNTKVRDLTGIRFPAPDYGMKLKISFSAIYDKTVKETEDLVNDDIFPVGHRHYLGWKSVDVVPNVHISLFVLNAGSSEEMLTSILESLK